MEKFCKFCGKGLKNDMCDCEEAVAETKANATNSGSAPVNETAGIAADSSSEIKLELPTTPEIIDGVVFPIEDPVTIHQPVVEVGSPEIPPPTPVISHGKISKEAGKAVGTTFMSFLLHPIKTSGSPESVSPLATIILVLIQAVVFSLLSVFGRKNVSGSFPKLTVGILAPMAAIFAGALVLFIALFLFSKISKPTLSIKGALGTVGLSTIPWILCTILLIILSFLLYRLPIIPAVMVFVCGFSAVFSTLIVERGANSKMAADGRRLFVVSLSVALQLVAIIIVYFLIFVKITNSIFM